MFDFLYMTQKHWDQRWQKKKPKRREEKFWEIRSQANKQSVSGSVFDGASTRNFSHVENNKIPNILSKLKPRSIRTVEACLEAKLFLEKISKMAWDSCWMTLAPQSPQFLHAIGFDGKNVLCKLQLLKIIFMILCSNFLACKFTTKVSFAELSNVLSRPQLSPWGGIANWWRHYKVNSQTFSNDSVLMRESLSLWIPSFL